MPLWEMMKFLQDIKEAAKELKPKFIALASSPIPFMNGTDFQGLARALTVKDRNSGIFRFRPAACTTMYTEQGWYWRKSQDISQEQQRKPEGV